ncbi:aminotransferase class I/II-fold pyridoxal phosphate-dependent enzyme [Streptomyces sp. BE147]|nr:aminotransferase class I/II-fold pyridoxal phosphate-dependent enzyme [Streptomyces sp. BE147]MEE1735556.1 aminotransferase class I/II-fold pyridoxal phosphate-dependent enzyme [Streptomyces sp. BE147]
MLSLDAYATAPDRFHLVYGLTKDFGLSGFRIGFLVSRSNAVRKVMQGDERVKSLAWFGPLDSLKSAYVRRLFGTTAHPSDFPATLMKDYRQSLKGAYDRAAATLRSTRIQYVGQDEQSRNAAQFFLLDLSAYLDSKKFPKGLQPPPSAMAWGTAMPQDRVSPIMSRDGGHFSTWSTCARDGTPAPADHGDRTGLG